MWYDELSTSFIDSNFFENVNMTYLWLPKKTINKSLEIFGQWFCRQRSDDKNLYNCCFKLKTTATTKIGTIIFSINATKIHYTHKH